MNSVSKIKNNWDEYWTTQNRHDLEQAQSYEQLVTIALDIISRMPRPLHWICGPISNGGLGSIEKNLEQFVQTIQNLRREGKSVFSQMEFEDSLMKIGEYSNRMNQGAKQGLLTGFYRPIFESRRIDVLNFIPDWQSSAGATWEHQQAERLGITINYLN